MNIFYVLLVFLLFNSPIQAASIANCKGGGINLSDIKYWGSDNYYNDILKMATKWARYHFDTKVSGDIPIKTDENGYPLETGVSAVVSLITVDNWGRDIVHDNTYVLLYDGEGDIEFGLNSLKVISKQNGRIVVQLAEKAYFEIIIKKTNPENHLRNFRMVPENHEMDYKEHPFRSDYIKKWKIFPVWRFMTNTNTNMSTITEWKQRTTPTTWAPASSVPYEYIAALANEAQIAPWINIPHMASDDYIRQMAEFFKKNLAPNLKIYVEYTNEAWNGGFPQYKYMVDNAKKLGIDDDQYFAQRNIEIFKIWESVYGENDKRLVRVLGAHFNNPWRTGRALAWKDLSQHLDAVAVGYYFGYQYGTPNQVEQTLKMNVDQLLDDIKDNTMPSIKKQAQEINAIVSQYNLPLIAYEAGQHLVGVGFKEGLGFLPDNPKLTDLFISANSHPKMYDAYRDSINIWNEIGGGLLVWFESSGSPSKWGSWGLIKRGDENFKDSPKMRSVIDYQNKLDAKDLDNCKFTR